MSSNFTFPNPQRSQGQPDFTPKKVDIIAMTLGVTTSVTTSADHGFSSDWEVTLNVPAEYGFTLESVKGKITVTGDIKFTIDVDTSSYSAFVVPTFPPAFTTAHAVPVSGTTDNVA